MPASAPCPAHPPDLRTPPGPLQLGSGHGSFPEARTEASLAAAQTTQRQALAEPVRAWPAVVWLRLRGCGLGTTGCLLGEAAGSPEQTQNRRPLSCPPKRELLLAPSPTPLSRPGSHVCGGWAGEQSGEHNPELGGGGQGGLLASRRQMGLCDQGKGQMAETTVNEEGWMGMQVTRDALGDPRKEAWTGSGGALLSLKPRTKLWDQTRLVSNPDSATSKRKFP